MPTVSVIVPNYNHAPYLNQRIESILSQTYQDFELILLDDCSTDNSREVLETYRDNPHVSHIVFNETNGGSPFAQWNKGVELAVGEWIWIAESDDWAEPEFLETILNALSKNVRTSLAFSQTNFINEKGELLFSESLYDSIKYLDGKEYIRNKLIFNNSIQNVSMVVFKKETFKTINHKLYDKMVLCGDWFFYVQMLLEGDVIVVNKLFNNYRIHSGNTSGWAERKGFTFTEGAEILDFITDHIQVNCWKYSKRWGKMLSDYSVQYEFTREVYDRIKQKLRKKHFLILVFNYIYKLKHSICSKK